MSQSEFTLLSSDDIVVKYLEDNLMILNYAKRFAKQGYYVFPTFMSKNGMQKPYGWALNEVRDEKGAEKAIPSTNLEIEIDQWAAKLKKHYNKEIAGYGIIGKNCIIIDVDNKNGKNGSANYEHLRQLYKLPKCKLIVKSKSGGFHLFFAKPEKFDNVHIRSLSSIVVEGVKFEGVDIRGTGGFVQGATCEGKWEDGTYTIVNGSPEVELSEMPEALIQHFTGASLVNDTDSIIAAEINAYKKPNDRLSMLKRGEMPESIPSGERNESFFVFITALKNKGIDKSTAKFMAQQLALRCEDQNDLAQSVNLDDMIERIFGKSIENPYDIAIDLVERGLTLLTGYRSKPTYVLLNDNPYLSTKEPHDLSSMKELMTRFAKNVTDATGKTKLVNPMEVAIRRIPPNQIASTIGFKPGAPDIFQMSDDRNAMRYLNTYQAPFIVSQPKSTPAWEEFKILISRIFGPEGTEEYNLGMDFTAWLLQYPDLKTAISVYLISEHRGVGKSLYLNLLTRLCGVTKQGNQNAQIRKIDDLTGRFFNPTGCILNIIDEVQFDIHRNIRQETSSFWRVLKNLVTADRVEVEIKNGGVFNLPNTASLILAGNSNSNFPIEEYDRRLWIIDSHAPIMEHGTVDTLYALIENTGKVAGHQERIDIVDHLRYELMHHKISIPLNSVRAPMNAIKREMYLAGLTELEQWWTNHFENSENILARTPMITKSAFLYLIESTDAPENPEWQETAHKIFNEAKKRKLLIPVKTAAGHTMQLKKSISVSPTGELFQSEKSDTIYMTRKMNLAYGQKNLDLSQDVVRELYIENLKTIAEYKSRKVKKSVITQADLLGVKIV